MEKPEKMGTLNYPETNEIKVRIASIATKKVKLW